MDKAYQEKSHNECFDTFSKRDKAEKLKIFLRDLLNFIKRINFSSQKDALDTVQNCITGVYIFDVEKFMAIFDKLVLERSDRFSEVPVGIDDEDGMRGENLNLNRPDMLEMEQNQDEKSEFFMRNGKQFRRVPKSDEEVIH